MVDVSLTTDMHFIYICTYIHIRNLYIHVINTITKYCKNINFAQIPDLSEIILCCIYVTYLVHMMALLEALQSTLAVVKGSVFLSHLVPRQEVRLGVGPCISASAWRTERSCWPACSCESPRPGAAGRPGAGGARGAAERAALPSTLDAEMSTRLRSASERHKPKSNSEEWRPGEARFNYINLPGRGAEQPMLGMLQRTEGGAQAVSLRRLLS